MPDTPTQEEPPTDEAPESTVSSPAPLQRFVTVLCTWLFMIYALGAIQTLFYAPERSPELVVPEWVPAVVRIQERSLEVNAVRATSAEFSDEQYFGALARTSEVYAELMEVVSDSERADLLARRAVLAGEQGDLQRAQWILDSFEDTDASLDFQQSFRLAYEGVPLPLDGAGASPSGSVEWPHSGWTRSILLQRLASNAGQSARQSELREESESRGVATDRAIQWIEVTRWVLLVLALVVAAAWWLLPARSFEVGHGLGKPPWSGAEGYAVLVRGGVLGFGLVSALYSIDLSTGHTTPFSWMSLWFTAPLLWLAWRKLLKPRQLDFRSAFGLRLARNDKGESRLFALLGTTSVLFVATQLGTLLLLALQGWTGFEARYSDDLVPLVVVGSTWACAMQSFDLVFFAAVTLELVARGVLYLTLRKRLEPHWAALASAGLSGLLLGLSLPSFLVAVWSGYLFALAYEKTRSLWPSLLCALFQNLTAVALLAVYR